MSTPLSLLSQLFFREPDRMERLAGSMHMHERWIALAAQGETSRLRQELFWAFGQQGSGATYPFAQTEVWLDNEHQITATSAALVMGQLDTLKLLVGAQRLTPDALSTVFQQAVFIWQRSQTQSPQAALQLGERECDCIAWLMSRGLDIRDHLPSFAVHERTSGSTLIKRTGDQLAPETERFLIEQTEQILRLYQNLLRRRHQFAPHLSAAPLSDEELVQEGWELMGHVFLRWRLPDRARQWLAQSEHLPFYPGVAQPSYLERNFRHYDIVEELLDRGVRLNDMQAISLIQTLKSNEKSRDAQWQKGFKPRKTTPITPARHAQQLEEELAIQANTLEVMRLIERYRQFWPRSWSPFVMEQWQSVRQMVAEREERLEVESVLLLRESLSETTAPLPRHRSALR